MTEDEMKNKISMALKDPILQQGFEIICKNLLELEEENAELKAYNEKLLNGDIEKHNKIAELEKENAELKEVHESDKKSLRLIAEKGAELEKELKSEKEYSATLRKEIDEYTNSHTLCAKYKELEKEISILLSCKNCPENKGGYICQKEYEDKCLAQKIQYIKELQEENAELKKQVEQKQHLADVRLEQSLENYKLFSDERKARIDVDIALEDMTDNLTKAKEHIRTLISCLINWVQEGDKDYCYITDAEQFLKECE